MRISLVEDGGWSPTVTPNIKVVDLTEIDKHSATQGRSLAEKLMKMSDEAGPENPHSRDAIQFTITIENEGKSVVFTSKSTEINPNFAELLSWLKQQLAAQRKEK